jgi:hypothetical protein
MCFIVLSCLLVIFHSIDYLDLSINSLTGTILSQIGLLTKLSESSIVRVPVVMIVVMFFQCTLMLVYLFYRFLGSLQH